MTKAFFDNLNVSSCICLLIKYISVHRCFWKTKLKLNRDIIPFHESTMFQRINTFWNRI